MLEPREITFDLKGKDEWRKALNEVEIMEENSPPENTTTEHTIKVRKSKRHASAYVKVPICIFCTHFFELLTPKSKTLAH